MRNDKNGYKNKCFWVGVVLLALSGYVIFISIALINLGHPEAFGVTFIMLFLGLLLLQIGGNKE